MQKKPRSPSEKLDGGTVLQWISVAAPPTFVLLVLARSWLEMAFFSRENRFSYYTALHHLCWYASAMLLIILVTHVILRIRPSRLLPLLYGIVVAGIPLIYSGLSNKPLNLEYLHGAPGEVLLQILTLSISEPRNHPLVPEVILIILGMGGLAYLLSSSWKKALALALGTWMSLSLIGLTWFGLPSAKYSIFQVSTRLIRPQALQAAAWLSVASALAAALIILDGGCREDRRSWGIAALIASEIWILWMLSVILSGWLPSFFDAFATGILPATLSLLIVRALRRDRHLVPGALRALMIMILLIQAAVVSPIILHRENALYRSREIRIRNPRQKQRRRINQIGREENHS